MSFNNKNGSQVPVLKTSKVDAVNAETSVDNSTFLIEVNSNNNNLDIQTEKPNINNDESSNEQQIDNSSKRMSEK